MPRGCRNRLQSKGHHPRSFAMLLDHAQACSAIARPLQMIVPIKFGVSPILLWLAYLQCDAECRLCLGFHILPRDPWLPFFQHQTLVGLDFERAEIGNAEFDQNFCRSVAANRISSSLLCHHWCVRHRHHYTLTPEANHNQQGSHQVDQLNVLEKSIAYN